MITVTNREEFMAAFGTGFESKNKMTVVGDIYLTDKDPVYSLSGIILREGCIANLRWLKSLKGVVLQEDTGLHGLENVRELGMTSIPKGVILTGLSSLESLRAVTIEKDCHLSGLGNLVDVVGLTIRRNTILDGLRALTSLRGISLGSNVELGDLYNIKDLKGIRYLGKKQIFTGTGASLDSEVDLSPDVIMKWWFRPTI